MTTLRSIKSDDSGGDGGANNIADVQGRRRTSSRTSIGSGTFRPSGSAPTIRPHKARNNSLTSPPVSSLVSGALFTPSNPEIAPSIPTFSIIKADHSQTGLEKVIKSRLVETFVAIYAPYDEPAVSKTPRSPSFPKLPSSPPFSPKSKVSFKASPSSPTTRTSVTISKPPSHHSRHLSVAVTKTERHTASTSTSPTPTPDDASTIPDYLSPIHPASINPSFSLDPRSDLPQWVNLSAERLSIELWAKIGTAHPLHKPSDKGKEKAEGPEWRVLDSWDFELSDLVPVPTDVGETFC